MIRISSNKTYRNVPEYEIFNLVAVQKLTLINIPSWNVRHTHARINISLLFFYIHIQNV